LNTFGICSEWTTYVTETDRSLVIRIKNGPVKVRIIRRNVKMGQN